MIGIFNDNFPPVLDGVALTAKNYADCLYHKGHEVCVVTPYAPEMPQCPYPIYTYPSMPLLMRKPYRLGVPQIDYGFRRQLASLPFSLVHAHCPFTSGTLALKTARKQHIPMVATFHSKYRQDFERAIPSDYIVDVVINHIVSFYEKAYEVWIPQASVEPTLREYGYKGKVTVVENGNDFVTEPAEIERLRGAMRRELGLAEGEAMLLFVGQHIWEKNIRLVIEALSHISNQPFHLYMCGTGYAEDAIAELINSLRLQDKVTMLGVVNDRERLKGIDAAADLFLFPSLYDNAPLVVREAAAMHTPAVMINGSTAAEVITDGFNGFLTSNDALAYAQLVSDLIQHPEKVKKAGDNASRTLARSWDDVTNEVIQRYTDIIARFHRENNGAF